MLFMDQKYADALEIWNRILPLVVADKQFSRSFSFRDAGVSAARMGDWERAAEYFRRGEKVGGLPFLENAPPNWR